MSTQRNRREFFARRASAFGVELANEHDRLNWEQGVRSAARRMGPRSTSESALLQYVRSTVDDTTRHVQQSLNVDVRATPLKDMNRPSFVAKLDVGRISPDPTDRKSATAQAAFKICDEQGRRKRRESGLAGIGSMAVKKP